LISWIGRASSSQRISTVLPEEKANPELHSTVQQALIAYFSSINSNGGVYRKKLELLPFSIAENEALGDLQIQIDKRQPFAFTSCFGTAKNNPLATIANAQKIPIVGAFSDFPNANGLTNSNVFYIYPGIERQATALGRFALKELSSSKTRYFLITEESDSTNFIQKAIVNGLSPNAKVITIPVKMGKLGRGFKPKARDVVFLISPPSTFPSILAQISTRATPPVVLLNLPLQTQRFEVNNYPGPIYFANRHDMSIMNQPNHKELLCYVFGL